MSDLSRAMTTVGRQMKEYTFPYLAQLFEVMSSDRGRFLGSGTYLGLRGKPYALTCSHVPAKSQTGRWGYSREDATQPAMVENWQCEGLPIDLALARLDEKDFAGHYRVRMLDVGLLASTSDGLEGDCLFVHGWPGERSVELWNIAKGIASTTMPYVTFMGESSRDWFDPEIHFAIDYRLEGQRDECGEPTHAPSPEGMSGSAVWKTNWKQHQVDWKPEHAQIVGVVFEWDQPGHALTCTRIEPVRRFLTHCLRCEAAYFRWLARGQPPCDDWADWFAASAISL